MINLPDGCIHPSQLRSLAVQMERLAAYAGGEGAPCLRRIEVTADGIVAHIATGAAVDGDWLRLKLFGGDWLMVVT